MLDENLPTFYFKPSPDNNALKSFLYFTHNGSEPAPEYLFQKVDPALPQSKNKYASALGDAVAQDVIFGEVLIEPEFQQPTLSAAEIRAQNGNPPPPPVPLIPDSFAIQLYNPDQQVVVRGEKSAWTGKESWEFEMPQQSFRRPSASKLDRQQSDENLLAPRVMFRWKRDGKFTRDMTCYMTGTSVNGRKSKDPDITVAMFKHHGGSGSRGSHSVTIYEPNLQRVDVEDRKGLEVVILLGAEVIREIYLSPSRDSFNVLGAPAPSSNKRKNSRPVLAAGCASSGSPTAQAHLMTSAIGNGNGSGSGSGSGNGRSTPAAKSSSSPTTAAHNKPIASASSSSPHLPSSSSSSTPGAHQQQQRHHRGQSQGQATAAIDAETRRLRAMVEEEEREERERRARAEERRTKKMLEQEEREERRRRETEVARETERLRREYGVEGQDFGPRPSLPPRPAGGAATPAPQGSSSLHPHGNNGGGGGSFPPPPRPSSAEPRPRLGNGISRLFHSPSPQPGSSSSSNQQGGGGRRRGKSSDGPGMLKKKSTLF
ncbi:hypothetical protein SLS62_009192 [Diatrype stigma]|uniref:Uncharacterized protein n=1 Tax=Diatrype stigma TaxID=117547 RepID=A0AAN9YLF8_9PEZI